MATAATGWLCTHSTSVIAETDTTKTIRVTCYWANNGWSYNINYVYGYVYCIIDGVKDKREIFTSGNVNTTSSSSQTLGYSDFVVPKGTSAKSVECYAKIYSESSYASGTKYSTATYVSVDAITSYTVSYNANGGAGAPTNQTKWYGTNLTLSSTTPTRTGYSFSKWNTKADGSGTSYSAGATYSGNAALTLYAIWTANTYVVTYNANGGTGAPANQTKTYGVDLTLSTTIPTLTNYNFLGWSTSANGGVVYQAGATYTSNSAVTLYAVWELAYVKPRIDNFSAYRCDSTGAFKEDGTYINVVFDWATDDPVYDISIQYKIQTDEEWIGISASGSGTSGSVSQIIGDGNIDTETSYAVRIFVSDSATDFTHNTYSPQRIIGTITFPIDVKKGGKGVAIGKVSEKDAFEVGMDIYDKTGQLISCKNVNQYTNEADSIRVICCAGMKIGGIYEVAISFNFNTAGHSDYRSTIYAILSLPCAYNGTTVVVRPYLNQISSYFGMNMDTTSRISVYLEGGVSEILSSSFNNLVYIYVDSSDDGWSTANWSVNVRPLVE